MSWQEIRRKWSVKPILLGLDRVQKARDTLAIAQSPPVVITVGGTNGKGSTCATLESILFQAGYKVGCYTSPDLLGFFERVRIDGHFANDMQLADAFVHITDSAVSESLSQFELDTLAAFSIFDSCELDVWILEVGLGGRLDAVNMIDADVAIVTSVNIDHTDYLGNTREEIGFEKAGIFRTGRAAICSDPIPPKALILHAQAIGADLWLLGRDFNYSGDKQQWNYSGRNQRRNSLVYPSLRGANQLLNASAALAALEVLGPRLPVGTQEVRTGLAMLDLPARFQVLPGRPSVILDVAHNPHAAGTLAQNLDNMGFHPYTYAVFGAMRDKDIDGVIAQMKDRVDHWCVTDLDLPRAATALQIETKLVAAGLQLQAGQNAERTIRIFSSPAKAFVNAMSRAGENDRIVVFGSFLTVAGVMLARNS